MTPYNNYPSNGGMPTPPPKSYMVWAILTTILCCLPFGIVSIVYASKVDGYWYAGNHTAAYDASNKAKNWALAAGITGLVGGTIYGILIAIYGMAMMGLSGLQ